MAIPCQEKNLEEKKRIPMNEIVFSKYTMPPDDTMVILRTMKTVTEPVCGNPTKSVDLLETLHVGLVFN